MPETSTAIVIAGMHRSGTSLVASSLAGMGIEVGRDLVPPDSRNPEGYFEDVEFLALQRRMLGEGSPQHDGGHVDWGWTPSERLDREAIATFREKARRLVDARSGRYRCWGWKDPRTTLLLDFWDEVLADARYVLVYRFPWEVADSMQRTGEAVFLDHPEWALRIWSYYNRHLIDFYRRRPDRCVLVSANALPEGFPVLRRLLRDKLGLELPESSSRDRYVSGLFRTVDASDPIVNLTEAASPRATVLLDELDRIADLPTPGGWPSRRAPALRFGGRQRRPSEPVALSVVIPCHNDRDFLIDAVASVERHATDDSELIVVNDGSTDARTLEILRALRALGYAVIDQENAGLSAARNSGIRAARGRYILPLDADNRIRRGFVDAAIDRLDASPEVGVVFGDRELFGWSRGRVAVAEFDWRRMLRSNYIDACAVLRRDVWTSCGGYDTALTGLEDWDFWLGAASHGWRFHRLDVVAFDYRVRPGSLIDKSLEPKTLRRLLRHIHRKRYGIFRNELPWPLRRLDRIAGVEHPVSSRSGAAARLVVSVNLEYLRSVWLFRSRAWRRHRKAHAPSGTGNTGPP